MDEKLFPVQKSHSYGKPHPLLIPWSVAELAYSQYHYSQTLERIAARGGFGPDEMDMYCPDWIERCDRITGLEVENERLKKQVDRLQERRWSLPVWAEDNERLEGLTGFWRGKPRLIRAAEKLSTMAAYSTARDAIDGVREEMEREGVEWGGPDGPSTKPSIKTHIGLAAVDPGVWVRVVDRLSALPEDAFSELVDTIMDKNAELYQRLADGDEE